MMNCNIYEYPPALCVDVLAPVLMKYYTKKIEEGAKRKVAWDKMDDSERQDCANKGYQRWGQKKASEPYDIKDGPPPFAPTHERAEIGK